MTRTGGKVIEGVLCTDRAQPQWETFRHCEEQVSEPSHIKARKLVIFPSHSICHQLGAVPRDLTPQSRWPSKQIPLEIPPVERCQSFFSGAWSVFSEMVCPMWICSSQTTTTISRSLLLRNVCMHEGPLYLISVLKNSSTFYV